MQGQPHASREFSEGKYIGDGNPGPYGGGTYSGNGGEHHATLEQYEEVFGPAARDIKQDMQRSKRHQRWHLPDALQGVNHFLTDRIDGLITDATNSPFTTTILPYKYVENPDAKIKWNVWSFDEGMASRVPYESAARVLTQSKRAFSAYTVRQGLAIAMEHNFMASPAGMENFRNQVKQMVGSIQYTNDLDVHMALIQAPSYARTMAEKYHSQNRTPQQLVRQYVDLFGIVQKNPNAMDLLIEEAKAQMRDWGSQEPNFLLCNGKLTLQLTMSPEKTSYVTQGIDGVKRLRAGPDIPAYRGVNIIKSRAFSMETNMPPRDVLRRRVRVAEYYWIPYEEGVERRSYQFYDEGRDSWVTFSWQQLARFGNQDFVPHQAPDLIQGNSNTNAGLLNRLGGNCNAATTTVDLESWNSRPYNLKIALLSSIGGLNIKAEDGSILHCNTRFNDSEKGFVQVAQQGANLFSATGAAELLPHVLSSAWIGGGLFSDTTYHLAKGNSYKTPLCNWASLNVLMANGNAASLPASCFNLDGLQRQSVDGVRSSLQGDDVYLQNFLPYQPNKYVFSLENAQGKDNGINLAGDVNSKAHSIAATFAAMTCTPELTRKLLSQCSVDFDTQHAYHNFLAPFNSETGTMDEDYTGSLQRAVREWSNKRFSPFQTVLMNILMSKLHPDSTIRKKAEDALGVKMQEIVNALSGVLRNAVSSNEIKDFGSELETTFPIIGEAAETAWVDSTGTPFQSAIKEFDKGMGNVDEDTTLTLFSLIMAKRMFCGAPRFSKGGDPNNADQFGLALLSREYCYIAVRPTKAQKDAFKPPSGKVDILLVRPNIEHEMLGMILGRGGTDELGATLWGQTELSCFDDSQHGIWGMSYKYHERAQVFNERNMVRTWDIAFDGYNGGMGSEFVDLKDENDREMFHQDTEDYSRPYNGKSFIALSVPYEPASSLGKQLPNPLLWYDKHGRGPTNVVTDPENIHKVTTSGMRIVPKMTEAQATTYGNALNMLPDFSSMEALKKIAGIAVAANESTSFGSMAFQGTMRTLEGGRVIEEVQGAGHLGNSYVGVAAVREGKGVLVNSAPSLQRLV